VSSITDVSDKILSTHEHNVTCCTHRQWCRCLRGRAAGWWTGLLAGCRGATCPCTSACCSGVGVASNCPGTQQRQPEVPSSNLCLTTYLVTRHSR